jgi:RNA-binding protein 8A
MSSPTDMGSNSAKRGQQRRTQSREQGRDHDHRRYNQQDNDRHRNNHYRNRKSHHRNEGDFTSSSTDARRFARRGRELYNNHSSSTLTSTSHSDSTTRTSNHPTVQKSIHKPCGYGPQQSIEGWVIIVTNVHEKAQEEDIREAFGEYGSIKNIHLNLDRKTGFCKGYALIEYRTKSEAQDAINVKEGSELLGKKIHVDWAFVDSAAEDEDSSPRKKRKYL